MALTGGLRLGACEALSHFAAGKAGSRPGASGCPPHPQGLVVTIWYTRDWRGNYPVTRPEAATVGAKASPGRQSGLICPLSHAPRRLALIYYRRGGFVRTPPSTEHCWRMNLISFSPLERKKGLLCRWSERNCRTLNLEGALETNLSSTLTDKKGLRLGIILT